MAIDELAPGSSHERQARAMDRLDPFEVTMCAAPLWHCVGAPIVNRR